MAPPSDITTTVADAPIEPRAAPQISAKEAADILRRGGVVAFPTETVYGLGADARNADAVARLYKIKGRPVSHPAIVHLASAEELNSWAREVPAVARKLADVFWPGPLTMVLKRAEGVPDAVTGGQNTVALRVPNHPEALSLLNAFGGGVAAPSANRYGRISPTSALHVAHDLGADIDGIVDGGVCRVGIESTIVDCTGDSVVILRAGQVSAAQIEAAVGASLGMGAPESPRVPGSTPRHYSPRAKLRLLNRVGMIETLSAHRGKRIAALALEVAVPRLTPALLVVEAAVASTYAQNLYANLRQLDEAGADMILVETPPATPSWTAILDRLKRAASE